MGQPWAKTIDEFIEHELAFHERLVVFADFLRQAHEELGLHLAEGLGRRAAVSGQMGIGLFPLPQFDRPLLLGGPN